jgi:hypothetical protein
MVKTKWPPKQDGRQFEIFWLALTVLLVRVVKNIIFVPKRSRLAAGFFCPVFGRSGYQMVGTGIRCNPNTARGSVYGGLLYNDFLKHKFISLFVMHVDGCAFIFAEMFKNTNTILGVHT